VKPIVRKFIFVKLNILLFYLVSTPQTPASASKTPTPPPSSSSSDDSSAKRQHNYTIDDFHFTKVLGKGSFGKVNSNIFVFQKTKIRLFFLRFYLVFKQRFELMIN
jgi:hypothetical protein